MDWLALWRNVAELSAGLEPDDPRLPRVRDLLQYLDEAFAQDDVGDFLWWFDHLKKVVSVTL